jgi:putative nucleotidyltransferase with HDIG domain
MNTRGLEQFLQGIHTLPSLSSAVMELLSSLNQDDIDNDVLATKIGQDPALTARTLKLANSSFYGMSFKSKTLREAVSVLGSRTVRRLATSAAMVDTFSGDIRCGFDVKTLWQHAIAVALCAGELARNSNVNQDMAYVAGLLHDVGRLVLATQRPADYALAMAYRAEHDCSVLQAERHQFDTDHAAVGAALIQHWRLPEELRQAIANHHTAQETDGQMLPLMVMVADAMAHALDLAADPNDAVPSVPLFVWQRLGQDDDTLRSVLNNVNRQFSAASSLLDS